MEERFSIKLNFFSTDGLDELSERRPHAQLGQPAAGRPVAPAVHRQLKRVPGEHLQHGNPLRLLLQLQLEPQRHRFPLGENPTKLLGPVRGLRFEPARQQVGLGQRRQPALRLGVADALEVAEREQLRCLPHGAHRHSAQQAAPRHPSSGRKLPERLLSDGQADGGDQRAGAHGQKRVGESKDAVQRQVQDGAVRPDKAEGLLPVRRQVPVRAQPPRIEGEAEAPQVQDEGVQHVQGHGILQVRQEVHFHPPDGRGGATGQPERAHRPPPQPSEPAAEVGDAEQPIGQLHLLQPAQHPEQDPPQLHRHGLLPVAQLLRQLFRLLGRVQPPGPAGGAPEAERVQVPLLLQQVSGFERGGSPNSL